MDIRNSNPRLREERPTKKPHASGYGAHRRRLFSRKAQSPQHGRVAWLTAFQPITVAGPRPIRTAFPAAHACKNEIRVYAGTANESIEEQERGTRARQDVSRLGVGFFEGFRLSGRLKGRSDGSAGP